MKAVILGANGYIGRHLSGLLLDSGCTVQLLDLQAASLDGLANYSSFDITDRKSFSCIDPDADYIFHFSAITGTAAGFEQYRQYLAVNELGTLNLLDYLKTEKSTARVVFPSTRLVYLGKEGILLNEESDKEARTIYALNKLSGERALEMYRNAFGLAYTIFRICVPYGSRFDGFSYGTTGFLIRQASENGKISVYGNGAQRRTFTHVEDVCSVMLAALDSRDSVNNIFNIGGEVFSIAEVARAIAERFGATIAHIDWPEEALRLESSDTAFDSKKLDSLPGVRYSHSFMDWVSGIG